MPMVHIVGMPKCKSGMLTFVLLEQEVVMQDATDRAPRLARQTVFLVTLVCRVYRASLFAEALWNECQRVMLVDVRHSRLLGHSRRDSLDDFINKICASQEDGLKCVTNEPSEHSTKPPDVEKPTCRRLGTRWRPSFPDGR